MFCFSFVPLSRFYLNKLYFFFSFARPWVNEGPASNFIMKVSFHILLLIASPWLLLLLFQERMTLWNLNYVLKLLGLPFCDRYSNTINFESLIEKNYRSILIIWRKQNTQICRYELLSTKSQNSFYSSKSQNIFCGLIKKFVWYWRDLNAMGPLFVGKIWIK